jgi:hypothetical protein
LEETKIAPNKRTKEEQNMSTMKITEARTMISHPSEVSAKCRMIKISPEAIDFPLIEM